MFTADYYEELVNAVADRTRERLKSGMKSPSDAFCRTVTDDYLWPELIDPEVSKSIRQHGWHKGEWDQVQKIRDRLEELAPERPDDCERAALAFSILFRDVCAVLDVGAS